MIDIANKRAGDWEIRRDGGIPIYVGRPSVLGNPYIIGTDGTREEVIEKYRGWLSKHMSVVGGRVWREIHRIRRLHDTGRRVVLVCWCKPAKCHADVIKEVVESLYVPDRSYSTEWGV
jgi:hypothetical protein